MISNQFFLQKSRQFYLKNCLTIRKAIDIASTEANSKEKSIISTKRLIELVSNFDSLRGGYEFEFLEDNSYEKTTQP